MKRFTIVLIVLLLSATVFAAAGCAGKDADRIIGTWEFKDEATGIGAVYELKKDGTGTYAIKAGSEEVKYDLKYEVKDGHLLVTFVNNSVFSADDVFDSEIRFKDDKTLIIKDSDGLEMEFVRK